MRIGVVYFDDPSFRGGSGELQGGWYSVNGEKPGRFARPTDLSSDTIWITNADYAAFKNENLAQAGANFRNITYLGASLAHVGNDLLLSPDNEKLDVSVQEMSRFVGRLCRLLEKAYRTPSIFGGYQVARGVRQVLMPNGIERITNMSLAKALGDAHQRSSKCVLRGKFFNARVRWLPVRKNRLSHIREVMETPFPTGKPEFIAGNQMGGGNRLAWLYSLGRPFLVKVALTNIDPEVADILSFGTVKGETGMSSPREWATSLEAVLYDSYATVSVEAAWVWPESASLPQRYQLPSVLVEDSWMELSYSAQLAAEIHMSAINMIPKRPQEQGGGLDVSPMAVWQWSMDRLLSFEMAKALADDGLVPFSYSLGAVTLRVVNEEDHDRINSIVRDAGWAFPLPLSEEHNEEAQYVS